MGCTAAVIDVDGTLGDSNCLHVSTWWQVFFKAAYLSDAGVLSAVGTRDLVLR